MAAALSAAQPLGAGYRPYERISAAFDDDGRPVTQTRDILRTGSVVGVLPVDLSRGQLILIRQFRLPGHLALDRGDMVEMPAGYVDAGETPAAAAARECREEIGLTPASMIELFRIMPAPGTTDELATLYAAAVDAAELPSRGGVAGESERVQPFRISIDAACAALSVGGFHNAYLVIALQWLVMNRNRLETLLAVTET